MGINSSPSRLDVHSILRNYGIHPNKGIGQNFLVDEAILQKIVDLAEVRKTDTVLEIGPGLGSLTRYLSLAAEKVVAVELDKRLIKVLSYTLSDFHNVSLRQGDILQIPLSDLELGQKFLVVANIPYNITSALIRLLLESTPSPESLVLTVQKEIADRICSQNKQSLLSISVKVFGKPTILLDIPAQSFYPVPKVDSSVIRIESLPSPVIPKEQRDEFFKVVRAGFSQKRKTLRNSLSAGLQISAGDMQLVLERSSIDSQRRAETLSIDEWKILTENIISLYPDR